MPEKFRRLALYQLHIHLHGMPLIGANSGSVLIEGIASLFIRADDLLQHRAVDLIAPRPVDAVHQGFHIRPAVGIERNADLLRLVAQDEG